MHVTIILTLFSAFQLFELIKILSDLGICDLVIQESMICLHILTNVNGSLDVSFFFMY